MSGEIDINSWKMKRNYPCGATKRRKREEAKSKNDALPKLTTFFNVSTTPPVVEEQQEAPANSEGEQVTIVTASCSSSDRRDVNNEEVVSSSPDSVDHHESVVIIGDDPALWPNVFSDCQRCDLVKRGPVQMELEFPQNAEGRRFTKANYFIVMFCYVNLFSARTKLDIA